MTIKYPWVIVQGPDDDEEMIVADGRGGTGGFIRLTPSQAADLLPRLAEFARSEEPT